MIQVIENRLFFKIDVLGRRRYETKSALQSVGLDVWQVKKETRR